MIFCSRERVILRLWPGSTNASQSPACSLGTCLASIRTAAHSSVVKKDARIIEVNASGREPSCGWCVARAQGACMMAPELIIPRTPLWQPQRPVQPPDLVPLCLILSTKSYWGHNVCSCWPPCPHGQAHTGTRVARTCPTRVEGIDEGLQHAA